MEDAPHSSFTPASSTPRNCFVTVTLAKKFHYYQKPISRASVVIFTFVCKWKNIEGNRNIPMEEPLCSDAHLPL
jgi:hypothetical protein